MASHSYSTLGFSLLQELGSNDIIKNRAYYLVNPGGRRHEIIPQSSFKLKLEHLEPRKPFCSWRSKSNHFVEFDSTMMKPRHVHETGREEVKSRVKPSPKKQKQNPKIRDRDNDLHRRNHLYACESLTSLMLGSEQHRQITLQSLKKSCGDLSELLTRLSIGFAGTGIAVFFSVVCSVASRRVFFCANEVFDGALSLSLVLLSWSVVRLRETIVDVNRKAIKEEEEITHIVERRIKDVYFRAATVIIMIALRFGRT